MYYGPYSINESEGGFRLNCAKLPLVLARSYAEGIFSRSNKSLDELIPDFDKNYTALQKACKKAIDIPRIQMPVIEPHDMKKFYEQLKSGKLDVTRPFAKGSLYTPDNLNRNPTGAAEYVELGMKDGQMKDDVVKAKWTHVKADTLLPSQSQIWLEKVIDMIDKFGVPTQGSPVTEATIIVSKEGYILDGHHRYGQCMIASPDLKLKALSIPIDIKTLIKISRSVGNAYGNEQKG